MNVPNRSPSEPGTTSCRAVAEHVVDRTLEVPSLRNRLATAPVTLLWRTPSLVVLDAGGPDAFVVGLTRSVIDIYQGPCDRSAAVAVVERLHLRPLAALSALWYAVFFALPFVGSLIADALAARWIRRVRHEVIATMEAQHGARAYAPADGRAERLAGYLARGAGQ